MDKIDRMMTKIRKTIFLISGWKSAPYFANKRSSMAMKARKKPTEGRYKRCSKMSSNGITVDSIIRLRKNQKIPKDIRGCLLLKKMAMQNNSRINISENKVVDGARKEVDKEKSCSRFILAGKGKRSSDM